MGHLLPISMRFFFYILNYRKAVLQVCRLLLERVVLYVVVILVHPWEEVSSESSYSTILIDLLLGTGVDRNLLTTETLFAFFCFRS